MGQNSKKIKLVSVKVRNGNFQKAFSIFKKRVRDSEHLWELKQRQEFTKPSLRKRKQKQKAKREQERWVKQQKENGLL